MKKPKRSKKRCPHCFYHRGVTMQACEELNAERAKMRKFKAEMAYAIFEMGAEAFQRDVMIEALAKALERAENSYLNRVRSHHWDYRRLLELQCEFSTFLADVQLVQAGCTRELGGSVWIRGEQLAEALRRYTDGH